MPVLHYLPLESYTDRYTLQLAAPRTGWNEANWIRTGVPYRRIEGPGGDPTPVRGDGPVIDTRRRAHQCFAQVWQLIADLNAGLIADHDAVFLDDFWTPGIEQFFLACDLKGVKPRVYAQWWAQSCDQYDFTRGSRDWIRHVEKGYLQRMAGVFVACPSLKYQVDTSYGQLGRPNTDSKVHVVGLPFRSADVTGGLGGEDYSYERELSDRKRGSKLVVWSSRLDTEKNPYMLHEVALYVLKYLDPEIRFVVCTGQPQLRGDAGQIQLLESVRREFPENITFRTGLKKIDYYNILRGARVQFNAANQDWVSFTLLEASAAGCFPVYPRYRSFPETFLYQQQYLYQKGNYEDAGRIIAAACNDDGLFTPDAIRKRAWVHERFDSTWARQLGVMFPDFNLEAKCPLLTNDPFDLNETQRLWPEAGL